MRPLPVPTRPVSRRSVDQFRQDAERARADCAQFPLGGAAVHVGIVERCGVCPRGPGCVTQPSEHPVGCRASRGSGRVVAAIAQCRQTWYVLDVLNQDRRGV